MKTPRRCWMITWAAQVGTVASLGCGARTLDPTGITTPGENAGTTTPGEDAGPTMPGADAGDMAPAASVGTWIAFDSDGGAFNRDIYVIRPDGTGRRRLTTESSVDAQPSFSRDGTKLAFASDRGGDGMQIYLMDLATGLAARVTQRVEGAHDPAFTIDGARVGYRSGTAVFTALLDGTDERQITDGASCCTGAPFGAPVFPNDGQSVIYDDYNAIYSASAGEARRTIVMPTTGEQSHPALSPDGSTVVVQSTCIGDNAARSLWTVPAMATTSYSCTDGHRLSNHGTDATHASWGPNNMIVWGSVTGGNNNSSPVPSSLVTWQDGSLGTLTSGSADDRNPSWSPGGTVIGPW